MLDSKSIACYEFIYNNLKHVISVISEPEHFCLALEIEEMMLTYRHRKPTMSICRMTKDYQVVIHYIDSKYCFRISKKDVSSIVKLLEDASILVHVEL